MLQNQGNMPWCSCCNDPSLMSSVMMRMMMMSEDRGRASKTIATFILLLHKLGFHLPADVGKVFPRIPHFWSADHIYSIALKIGPIDKENMKFTQEEMEKISKKNSEEAALKKVGDKSLIDEIEDVGSGFESMDLDLLNVSPSGQQKLATETGAWLNLAQASKEPVPGTSKDDNMEMD